MMDNVDARTRWISAAHEGLPRCCLLASLAALLVLVATAVPGASAQKATPAADLGTVRPEECTVEPRSEEDLRALFREVAATPIPASLDARQAPAVAPDGAPADEQIVAEINAVWRSYLACLSSGDQARMFALYSDAMVRRQLMVDIAFGVTEEALFDYLAATPVPLPPDQPISFEPFGAAATRMLGDGRVAVVGPGDAGRGDVLVFVREDGRWLIDDWFDDASPPQA